MLIVSFTFFFILIFSFCQRDLRKRILQRSSGLWVLDIANLFLQGILVPLLQTVFLFAGLNIFFSESKQSWDWPGGLSFLLSFTLIDYVYYWNHRWLHQDRQWPFHRVHHSATNLDLFVTSRNSFWTIFMIVYLWIQAILLFFLKDPWPFAAGVAVSAGLDIWRHSGWKTPNFIFKSLGSFLILPEDHEWHHSRERQDINFGANLNVWDRWHGTFYRPQFRPQRVGLEIEGPLKKWFFTPWKFR